MRASPRRPHGRTRRDFLAGAASGALGLLVPGWLAAAPARAAVERRALAFHDLHTGESLSVVYRIGGRVDPDALARIDRQLRDHRSDEVHPIEPSLLDLLHDVQRAAGSRAPYQVISGYRSPRTNAMLIAQGHAVSARSLHMEGMAVDVRLGDVPTGRLREIARSLRRGGVGYYPESDFVHLDVGRVRTW